MQKTVVGRNQEDREKFETKGAMYLGKNLVGTGQDAHLTTPLFLDALRPHSIVVCGKRGSGKSYTLGIISEEIRKLPKEVRKNLSVLMFDTQGIFWTMKTPNDTQLELLKEWDLGPDRFPANVYIPQGQSDVFKKVGVEFDRVFSIAPHQLNPQDWVDVFELEPNNALAILLERVLDQLTGTYSINDMVEAIEKNKDFSKRDKMALENRLLGAKTWGIFGEEAMPTILEPGKLSIIDMSLTPLNVRSLLIALVSRKILEKRIEARRQEEMATVELSKIETAPMCWILIDEAHNFIPRKGNPISSRILTKIIKEGRQPGISTVFATQRPEKLHPDALSQSDIVISHRITNRKDIQALKGIMQTYMLHDIEKYINELPAWDGVALILDDNSERLYKARVRPRQSWHAGSTPVAL